MINNIIDLIGNTPLIKLQNLSKDTGCDIYGKAEFLNPGGSIKDRTALGIIRDAERSGQLKPGGFIVEGTAGNTGIGLCLLANILGYKVIIVMPETQSQEKIDTLRLYGADLRLVPALPYKNPNNYVRVSQQLAQDIKAEGHSVIWANQFDNVANKEVHYQTTGQEIWQQTQGNIDGFICSVGTGGTLAGVAKALREKKPDIAIGLADPMGASLYNYYTEGELKSSGGSITEGIGQGRITENLKSLKVDYSYQVKDEDALPVLFDLLDNEGLCLGGSSAINLMGAKYLAQDLGPGHTIVTVLCDMGYRYFSKLYNPQFLANKGLPIPPRLK